MIQTIRIFLLFQGTLFIAAALTHFGVLLSGYEHQKAGIAESVIGAVLVAGLLLTWIFPASSRTIGLAAQSFALLGTAVGIFTIVIGVGPRTAFDMTLHVCMVAALAVGLFLAARTHASPQTTSSTGRRDVHDHA